MYNDKQHVQHIRSECKVEYGLGYYKTSYITGGSSEKHFCEYLTLVKEISAFLKATGSLILIKPYS